MSAFSYVLATCDTGHEDFLISKIQGILRVRDVHGVFGAYDLITQIENASRDEMIAIANKIRNINHIRATLTLFENNMDYFKPLSSSEYDSIKKYMAQAYVLINCRKGTESSILEKLSKVPEIIEGNSLIGIYDAIVRMAAPTYNEISDVIAKVRAIEEIKSTNTLNLIPKFS